MKLLLGLVKGAAVGVAIGFGAYYLGMRGGFNWITYGLVGAIVGLVVGRPIWTHLKGKDTTFVTSILKSVFGYLVGIGIYAIIAKAWGGMNITISGEEHNLYNWQPIMGGVIGALYGGFIEMDDSGDKKAKAKQLGT
jgi:hypothetical protein